MEKSNYSKYLDYIAAWFKGHSLDQRIGQGDEPREHPLTISEWLEREGATEGQTSFLEKG